MIVTSFILFILFIPSETNALDMIYRIYMIVTSFILLIPLSRRIKESVSKIRIALIFS